MSQIEHLIFRFVLPLLYVAGSIAFVVAAYHGYMALAGSPYRIVAGVLCTFAGLWLVSWTVVILGVALTPSIWEAERNRTYSKEALRQIAEW